MRSGQIGEHSSTDEANGGKGNNKTDRSSN
jgi:hypothetical protein